MVKEVGFFFLYNCDCTISFQETCFIQLELICLGKLDKHHRHERTWDPFWLTSKSSHSPVNYDNISSYIIIANSLNKFMTSKSVQVKFIYIAHLSNKAVQSAWHNKNIIESPIVKQTINFTF